MILPGVSLRPDASWLDSVAGFRSITGGVLAVVLVLSVVGLVLAGTGLAATRIGWVPPGMAISTDALVRVVVGALIAASVSGMVAWSFNLKLGLGSFSADSAPYLPPYSGPLVPGVDECAPLSPFHLPRC